VLGRYSFAPGRAVCIEVASRSFDEPHFVFLRLDLHNVKRLASMQVELKIISVLS